ncbi:hypothetical protein CEXT_702751 [Caerostris extrusa]|uniref:Uncharacterized protein n=1 Tax=Caerostris extrusa TaxID=172846 RepID=A0AAV4Q8L1_CAEEX|nr:hypothetical protein CEXT_702751 [Caerostris extrusa]
MVLPQLQTAAKLPISSPYLVHQSALYPGTEKAPSLKASNVCDRRSAKKIELMREGCLLFMLRRRGGFFLRIMRPPKQKRLLRGLCNGASSYAHNEGRPSAPALSPGPFFLSPKRKPPPSHSITTQQEIGLFAFLACG